VDGNPEIYSINIDDAVVKRLTNNKADDTSPKWSPDGSKIAFVSMRDGNSEVYMMNSDGSDVTRITTDDSSDVDPAWSPDGKKIVFSSNRDGDYEIFVHTLDTNAEEQLTQNYSEDRNPNWSSKSDTILYKSIQYGSPGFYELNISTGKDARVPVQIVPLNISYLTLSHNSLKFLYEGGISASSSSIVMHDISDKRSIELVGKIGSNFSPVWSPTDKQIAYASNSDGQTDIYIINDEGTSIFRLTNNTAKEWDIDWTGN
jgi:TolB protein